MVYINNLTDVFSPTTQDYAADFKESAPVKLVTANLTIYVPIVTLKVMVPTIAPKLAQLEERGGSRGDTGQKGEADWRREIAAPQTKKPIRGVKPMGCMFYT